MKASNHKQPGQNQPGNELDRMLDATLARYAAVEPRTGLEDRVLANLHAERAKKLHPAWWPWAIAAAAVAMLVVVLMALPWRAGRPTPPVAGDHRPSLAVQGSQETGTHVASNGPERPTRPRNPDAAPKKIRRVARFVDQPKLDQFPSPQPLSEQEKILANYVAKYPEHAVLIARARTEQLRLDELEEMLEGNGRGDSEDRNPDASGR